MTDSMEIKVVVSLLWVVQDIKLLVPLIVKLLTLILLVALWMQGQCSKDNAVSTGMATTAEETFVTLETNAELLPIVLGVICNNRDNIMVNCLRFYVIWVQLPFGSIRRFSLWGFRDTLYQG